MAGYRDTRQLIIDTLMGRPAGTEIQPEDHQAFALQITDYVRSVELVAGNATPIGFADASTIPVQPDNGQAVYLSQVGRGTTVVFTNFIDQNGNAISVTSDSDSVTLVNLLWNGQYWTKQETRISLKNTVQENDIADGAVTTPKIANNAVTDIKLAPLSVGESRIKGLAVTTPKIANKAVTTEKIAEKAVTVSRIVDGAVTTPKISDGAVTSDKIADYAVIGKKIASGAITNDKIGDDAVTNDKISPEAITIDKLELDLEAMVSDNVKYRKQILTDAQKAQARKNIDVDYLTEDEVANLWDTTN